MSPPARQRSSADRDASHRSPAVPGRPEECHGLRRRPRACGHRGHEDTLSGRRFVGGWASAGRSSPTAPRWSRAAAGELVLEERGPACCARGRRGQLAFDPFDTTVPAARAGSASALVVASGWRGCARRRSVAASPLRPITRPTPERANLAQKFAWRTFRSPATACDRRGSRASEARVILYANGGRRGGC